MDSLPSGARVFIDGVLRGEAPLEVELDPGRHNVRVEGRSGTRVESVTVGPGEQGLVVARFTGHERPSAPVPEPPGPVEEPRKKHFGKGSWVRYRILSESAGKKSEVVQTAEIVSSTDDSHTVRLTTEHGDGTRRVSSVVMKHGDEDATGFQVERGRETLRLRAGVFDCERTRTRTDDETRTVWRCDEVPLGVIRTQTTAKGVAVLLELVAYHGR